jgi:hypothetical protein
MWIFTIYGFYSIACADKPGRGRKIDPETVMVRARVRQHLKNLQNRFRKSKTLRSIARTSIEETRLTDYRYRLILPKAVWVQALGELAMEQTWSNFKNEAHDFERKNDQSPDYVDALHDIWAIMHRVQIREGVVASPPRKVTYGKR